MVIEIMTFTNEGMNNWPHLIKIQSWHGAVGIATFATCVGNQVTFSPCKEPTGTPLATSVFHRPWASMRIHGHPWASMPRGPVPPSAWRGPFPGQHRTRSWTPNELCKTAAWTPAADRNARNVPAPQVTGAEKTGPLKKQQ